MGYNDIIMSVKGGVAWRGGLEGCGRKQETEEAESLPEGAEQETVARRLHLIMQYAVGICD